MLGFLHLPRPAIWFADECGTRQTAEPPVTAPTPTYPLPAATAAINCRRQSLLRKVNNSPSDLQPSPLPGTGAQFANRAGAALRLPNQIRGVAGWCWSWPNMRLSCH